MTARLDQLIENVIYGSAYALDSENSCTVDTLNILQLTRKV